MKKCLATLMGVLFLFSVSMVSAQTKVVEPSKTTVTGPVAPVKLDAQAEKKAADKAAKEKKAAEKKAVADKKAAEKKAAADKKAAEKAAKEKKAAEKTVAPAPVK